jgi:hypothetical protein
MKNTGKLVGMLLLLLIAGNGSLNAQRGMRGMRPDSAAMNSMRMEQRHMHQVMQNADTAKMGGMRHGIAPGQIKNKEQFMCPMCMMRQPARGMNQFQGRGQMGRGMRMTSPSMGKVMRSDFRSHAPGMRLIENIPDLTEKQKMNIDELNKKQQQEMQKFREGMQTKMKEMRDSHKSKILGLLTDEQKKWVEENTPKPEVK